MLPAAVVVNASAPSRAKQVPTKIKLKKHLVNYVLSGSTKINQVNLVVKTTVLLDRISMETKVLVFCVKPVNIKTKKIK